MNDWPEFVPQRWQLSETEIYNRLRHPVVEPDQPRDLTVEPFSCFIPMVDGVHLAADIWMPARAPGDVRGERRPVVVTFTRYWRSLETSAEQVDYGFVGQLASCWEREGYTYVVVDVRGTGASFGNRAAEYSSQEIEDYGAVIDWVAVQDWCNGFVATEGGSYPGNASELAAVHHPKGLKASIPRYTDFDAFQAVAYPGGIHNLPILINWSAVTRALDQARIDNLFQPSTKGTLALGPRRTSCDTHGELRNAAIEEHGDNYNLSQSAFKVMYADTAIVAGITRENASIHAYRDELEAAAVPQFAWASWMDAATADGLLSRFTTLQQIPIFGVIGTWSHLTANKGDPFGIQDVPDLPTLVSEYADFLNKVAKGEISRGDRELRYYTMVEDRWKQTNVWPPQGIQYQDWYLSAEKVLQKDKPETTTDVDYQVNRTATTGTTNRWYTQMGGGAVTYPDRSECTSHLLVFATAPFDEAVEVTGHPIVTLFMSCNESDATIFAYLEDVDPNGRVTYITEGQLRAIHRKTSETAPDWAIGPHHTFREADAEPLVPGEPTEIAFRLLPTSVLIRPGHRLRIALAGADIDTFAVFPNECAQEWKVSCGGNLASKISLPMAPVTSSESGKDN